VAKGSEIAILGMFGHLILLDLFWLLDRNRGFLDALEAGQGVSFVDLNSAGENPSPCFSREPASADADMQ